MSRVGCEVAAHGIVGGRADLPVPYWLSIYAGSVAVLASFYVVAALWHSPRFSHPRGFALRHARAVVDSRTTHALARALGLLALAAVLAAAWLGPDDRGVTNPAPTWFYVWFWVGLVPASLLLGPVWRAVNPGRTLAGTIRALSGARVRRLPEPVRYWPAVLGLVAFAWLELVYDAAASPRVVGAFIAAYVVIQTIGGVIFGGAWFDRCDAFEVFSTVISYAAPVGRDAQGDVILRNPLVGLGTAPTRPSMAPVIVVTLGATAFDGLSRTTWWAARIAGTDRTSFLLDGTIGLFAVIGIVALTYGFGVAFMRTDRTGAVSALMAPSLIPILIGYSVAHYFSFAVFQGQAGVLLANDPLGRGWNLLELRGAFVDYSVVSANTIAVVQISAIVLGHVVAVVSAHDIAVGQLRRGSQRSGQYAMVGVMIAYTVAGIALLAGAG